MSTSNVRAEIRTDLQIGDNQPLTLIAGPCVIESKELVFEVAGALSEICKKLKINLVFKSSYDKANRTSNSGYRGLGLSAGLEILSAVKNEFKIAMLTDIHESHEAKEASEVVDVLQIPAYLCRQTELLKSAALTGKAVNVKKGQFLAPWDMSNVVNKLRDFGAKNIIVTERGSSFGYNALVVDYRSLPQMREFGCPIVFDVTHSVQQPGGLGSSSGGQREFAAALARAAVAVGVDGLFMEVHPDPDKALSDGPNMIPLHRVEKLLSQLLEIRQVIVSNGPMPSTY
ncbi:MAG: 3-deoxy-8-phosphooctulonate synthase [Actinomycetota bacterium]|jgi:2-dehydro-3-deoxyphosphooctonate aldolase (KDO 8-P synthase)|nr:3-deoxy-8-phosphooctulonate synthase [Actinomycetota bacterium]